MYLNFIVFKHLELHFFVDVVSLAVNNPRPSQGAFTPDANDANKSRYSREVGRLNILSLLASFAREIRAIRT